MCIVFGLLKKEKKRSMLNAFLGSWLIIISRPTKNKLGYWFVSLGCLCSDAAGRPGCVIPFLETISKKIPSGIKNRERYYDSSSDYFTSNREGNLLYYQNLDTQSRVVSTVFAQAHSGSIQVCSSYLGPVSQPANTSICQYLNTSIYLLGK
jgi:hypothetical protein